MKQTMLLKRSSMRRMRERERARAVFIITVQVDRTDTTSSITVQNKSVLLVAYVLMFRVNV